MNTLTDTVTFRHGAQVKNRLAMSPMQTSSGLKGGFVSKETIAYDEARSQAAGLLITEFHYVSKNGGPCYRPGYLEQLAAYSDAHLEGLKNEAAALKKDGNKAILQIHHGGREAVGRYLNHQDVVAPSAIDYDFLEYPVRALTHEEILDIIKDFGKATKRAIEAGFDGVEIHGANHYLLQQFFSTLSNHRDDAWGGSLEKRMAFPLAVVKEVKRVAKEYGPKDFIIGYRLSPEEIHGDLVGYTYHESTKLIHEIAKNELDYIHLSLWDGYKSSPKDTNKTYAQLFREVMDEQTKLIVVGGVFSEEAAQDAINYSDLIAVGRGTLIDPKFGKKIMEGRGDEIIHEISPEVLEKACWPKGLKEIFTRKDSGRLPPLPNGESIWALHTGEFDQ